MISQSLSEEATAALSHTHLKRTRQNLLQHTEGSPSCGARATPHVQALHRGLHPSRAWSMSPQPELRIATTAAPESRAWHSFTADSGTRAVRPAPEHPENLAMIVLGDEIAEKGRKG